MVSLAREADLMTRRGGIDKSRCFMALLPPETKMQIISHISTQESLSCLGQSCRAWYEVAIEELYKRDSRENDSFAIKWMAAHAVDDQTTASALRTVEISRLWGGQIDAVERPSPRDRRRSDKDQLMYESSTALHFAVFLGNVRLTETLLDMKASLTIPCPALLWELMGTEELLLRVSYFESIFSYFSLSSDHCAFPIFLAFLQSDPEMCKLLVDHGAGREATIKYYNRSSHVFSILHFAAADPTTDYRQWQCLFDGFLEFIDEPCRSPRDSQFTPLHVALFNGCTQGMQIAVETGADKESKNSDSRTPLYVGVLGMKDIKESIKKADPRTIEEHTRCFRKFVELGASVNPEGDSVLILAVKFYAESPVDHPIMRHLIYFLLDHHADIHGSIRSGRWNFDAITEILRATLFVHRDDTPAQRLLEDLLSDLVDRGLNLTKPAPGLPSPLRRVLKKSRAEANWLFDFLCENGATIHDDEVDSAFLSWCSIPRLWSTNEYNAWWQHQGQEDEIFQKWCEHPSNAWWWPHANHISPSTVTLAYRIAFRHEDRQLYDILTHLPLAAPSYDVFVNMAFISTDLWGWRQVVLHEFEDNFLATYSHEVGDNLIHLTVRKYVRKYFATSGYSATDAGRDILHLRDKGVDMTSRNSHGQTPLEILLKSGSSRDGFMELAALLEGKVHKVQELA